MDFKQLSFLVAIVDCGSISKAAKQLFVSQPNISAQIKLLEENLGEKVLVRNNKGVSLTSFGVEVYNQAKSLLDHFDIVNNTILSKSTSNKIKIASFGSEIIQMKFYELCELYNINNNEFTLFECGTEEAISKVKERICDIGIVLYSDYHESKLLSVLNSEKLSLVKLFTGVLSIHLKKESELSSKAFLTSHDLNDLYHVKKSYLFDGVFSLEKELKDMNIPESNKIIYTNSNNTYNGALINLPSYAVEIDWYCNKKVDSKFNRVNYENKRKSIHCGLVTRKNEEMKLELGYFKDELIKAYSKEKGENKNEN